MCMFKQLSAWMHPIEKIHLKQQLEFYCGFFFVIVVTLLLLLLCLLCCENQLHSYKLYDICLKCSSVTFHSRNSQSTWETSEHCVLWAAMTVMRAKIISDCLHKRTKERIKILKIRTGTQHSRTCLCCFCTKTQTWRSETAK